MPKAVAATAIKERYSPKIHWMGRSTYIVGEKQTEVKFYKLTKSLWLNRHGFNRHLRVI